MLTVAEALPAENVCIVELPGHRESFVFLTQGFVAYWNFPVAVPGTHPIIPYSGARLNKLLGPLAAVQADWEDIAVIGFTFRRKPVMVLTSPAAYRQWARTKLAF
jgi:hypothetical protein